MWNLKTGRRAETDQSVKAAKSAGSMQAALVEAGVVKQSQVNAVRKESTDSTHQRYVASVSPDAIEQLKKIMATAIKLFEEKRHPEALLDWRELELMVEIEKMYVNTKTHGFVSHLVASFAAYPDQVRPPKMNANGLSDPISRVKMSHTSPAIDGRIIKGLQLPLNSDGFKKAREQFFKIPETPVASPHSQTFLSGISFRSLKRWVAYQVDVLENEHIIKLMRPR